MHLAAVQKQVANASVSVIEIERQKTVSEIFRFLGSVFNSEERSVDSFNVGRDDGGKIGRGKIDGFTAGIADQSVALNARTFVRILSVGAGLIANPIDL